MAAEYDITIDDQRDFTRSFTWKDSAGDPVNITGYNARFTVKSDEATPVEVLSVDSATDASITVTGTEGKVDLHVLGGNIGILATRVSPSGRYNYELLLYDNANGKISLLVGTVKVNKAVA